MKSAYQSILLAVVALSSSAQPTQPIEAQFRIVTQVVDRSSAVPTLVERCMGVDMSSMLMGFAAKTAEQDAAFCKSNDSLFTLAKMSSMSSGGNFFIGDYIGGTAKHIFVQSTPLAKEAGAFSVDNSTARLVLDPQLQLTARNELQFINIPTYYAELNLWGLLVPGNGGQNKFLPKDKLPTILPVKPSIQRRFRLKRFDPSTNVTSCATLTNGLIRFTPTSMQANADKLCAQSSSIFTFNSETRQLSIGARRVTTGTDGLLRAMTDDVSPNLFYLMPEGVRSYGGLMVARPASTLMTSASGYIRAGADFTDPITVEFWPEFIE